MYLLPFSLANTSTRIHTHSSPRSFNHPPTPEDSNLHRIRVDCEKFGRIVFCKKEVLEKSIEGEVVCCEGDVDEKDRGGESAE